MVARNKDKNAVGRMNVIFRIMERDPFVRPVPYPSYRMGGDCRVEIASRYFGGRTPVECGRLSFRGHRGIAADSQKRRLAASATVVAIGQFGGGFRFGSGLRLRAS